MNCGFQGDGRLTFNGYREFWFYKIERVLETSFLTMLMYLRLLNCTLKHGCYGKFYVVYILPQLKSVFNYVKNQKV